MTMLDRVNNLRENTGKSAITVCTEAGITKGAISDWNRGRAKPSLEAIIKLAEYFDVSLDYIIYGETDIHGNIPKSPANYTPRCNIILADDTMQYNITFQEDILVSIYRNLPENLQNRLLAYAQGLSDASEKQVQQIG